MRDQHAGNPGKFLVDGEAGIRVPAEDWDLYQFNKASYLADADQAKSDYENSLVKTAPKVLKGDNDAKLS